jgi:hypothetical protein
MTLVHLVRVTAILQSFASVVAHRRLGQPSAFKECVRIEEKD